MVKPIARHLAQQLPIEFERLISHSELKLLLASHITGVQAFLREAKETGVHTMSAKKPTGKTLVTHAHLSELVRHFPRKFKNWVVEQHAVHVEDKFRKEHGEKIQQLTALVEELEEKQNTGTFDKSVQRKIIELVLYLEKKASSEKTTLPLAAVKARQRYENAINETHKR